MLAKYNDAEYIIDYIIQKLHTKA